MAGLREILTDRDPEKSFPPELKNDLKGHSCPDDAIVHFFLNGQLHKVKKNHCEGMWLESEPCILIGDPDCGGYPGCRPMIAIPIRHVAMLELIDYGDKNLSSIRWFRGPNGEWFRDEIPAATTVEAKITTMDSSSDK